MQFNDSLKNSAAFARALKHFNEERKRRVSIDYDENRLCLKEFESTKSGNALIFYTAISGGYSRLLPPAVLIPGARYVCFTDFPSQTYGVWEIRPLPKTFAESPRWASRWCKLHPHELFPNAEIAVWIDGNVIINGDMQPHIQRILGSNLPLGMIKHPKRDCVYEEIEACLEANKDSEARLLKQKARYQSLGLPAHGGVHETRVIINNMGHPDVPPFYDLWWQELSTQSIRDQVSLPYVLDNLKLTPGEFLPAGISAGNSPDFILVKHHNTFSIKLNGAQFSTEVKFPEPPLGFSEYRQKHPDCFDAIRDRRADVIVAVHNGLEYVKACLTSLLPTLREEDGLIVVNDLSDAETGNWLREFAKSDFRITLLENDQNLGYTGSANRGLRESNAHFRVMLNSDTLVSPKWLEKMLLVAYCDETTGIVGPLSNAASSQSVPFLNYTQNNTPINALPEGKSVTDMALFCEAAAPYGIYPSVPFVHGFCFGIRQEVIDTIGFFDEVNFARFFGEENDYCLRATEAGFTLRVATPVYVYHAKSMSITEEMRPAYLNKANRALEKIYSRRKMKDALQETIHNPSLIDMRNKFSEFYQHCEAGKNANI
jgi:GT2 family glycosyltransferase